MMASIKYSRSFGPQVGLKVRVEGSPEKPLSTPMDEPC